MEAHYYNVDVNWNSERKGVMCSPELNLDVNNCIEVATPPEFPKGIPGIWSPEHLFTAAVSSCLMTTFLSVAENSKLNFKDFSCSSKGKMEQVDGKFIMSEILLEPTVTITDEKDRERTERILQKSEAACLISNSVKSKIIMHTKIICESAAEETTAVM
ncbi:MAG: OsmC family protein [Bacteroidia bacterium]|nr:OsmC family protein [Bacteroidia bacterium]